MSTKAIDRKRIERAVREILLAIGEDPERPGLKDTPKRVANMCEEIYAGIGKDTSEVVTALHSENHDEIVPVKNIPFYSVCEHHILPFLGAAHVAYIPDNGRLTGISKMARVVKLESQKLQVQERLTTAIAENIMEMSRFRVPIICIVIGEGGRMLKRIGRSAREEIERMLGTKVYLDLWVKVRKKWRKDEKELRRLGYALPKKARR